MKIRNGFVSNSSSSSFVIVSKDGELTQEKLLKAFEVSEKSPLFTLAKEIAGTMMNADEYTSEKFLDNFAYGDSLEEKEKEFKEDYPEYYEIYEKAKNNGWKIYMGYADSYDEAALCEMTLHYEDDELLIDKEGGY